MKKGGDSILKKKQLLMALLVAIFVSGTVGVQAASAATKTTTTATVAANSNQNRNNDGNDTTSNTRPGWGNGDKNHHHVGPPGQSGRPGDGDHDGDDGFRFRQFLTLLRMEFHDFFGHFFS